MLATGNARMAMFKPQQQSFMLHSVVDAVSLKELKDVLLEAAEFHKLEPHPNLLPLRAVVTDQPWGEVCLLSELLPRARTLRCLTRAPSSSLGPTGCSLSPPTLRRA